MRHERRSRVGGQELLDTTGSRSRERVRGVLIYDSPEPSQRKLLLIFETDGTRVTSLRAGERGAVEAPEGYA